MSLRWRDLAPRLRRVLLPAQSALLLRTTAPIGKNWGWDRGTPVDRFYIESFLERHRRDISGRVLEIKDASYTRRFGRGVTTSDVLDVNRENSGATIYADLAAADEVPSDAFDCIILTQTLQFIFDIPAALTHLHRVLASEGVVLRDGADSEPRPSTGFRGHRLLALHTCSVRRALRCDLRSRQRAGGTDGQRPRQRCVPPRPRRRGAAEDEARAARRRIPARSRCSGRETRLTCRCCGREA
jgi:hypothetical protein